MTQCRTYSPPIMGKIATNEEGVLHYTCVRLNVDGILRCAALHSQWTKQIPLGLRSRRSPHRRRRQGTRTISAPHNVLMQPWTDLIAQSRGGAQRYVFSQTRKNRFY